MDELIRDVPRTIRFAPWLDERDHERVETLGDLRGTYRIARTYGLEPVREPVEKRSFEFAWPPEPCGLRPDRVGGADLPDRLDHSTL